MRKFSLFIITATLSLQNFGSRTVEIVPAGWHEAKLSMINTLVAQF